MAPEVLRCKPHTEKCDVWSFGIVMGEVLTRSTTPYSDMNHAQIGVAVLVDHEFPPVPDDCCPGVPELVLLLHRCRQLDSNQVLVCTMYFSHAMGAHVCVFIILQRPTFAEITDELDALDFTKQQTERGEQRGPATPRLLKSGSGRSFDFTDDTEIATSASPTVLKEGPLWFFTKTGKRVNRFFQLVHAPSASAGGTQLTLVAFKADPNPQRTQPPPVGATESASAR
jgi:serine/threonine protein kinase